MSLDYHALSGMADAGAYPGDATTGITSNTDKRDVSEMLDLLTLSETPFIQRVGWGPEGTGTTIEWLSENLGPMYALVGSVMASAGTSILLCAAPGLTVAETGKQFQTGTVFYHYSSTDGVHALLLVTANDGAGEIEVETLSTGTTWSVTTSLTASEKLHVLGAMANEGSVPRGYNIARARTVCSNGYSIFRQDVAITGSMKSIDMYAIAREDTHQIKMRMKELARERERSALISVHVTPRSTTEASLMNGCVGFLAGQTGDHIDTSTTSLIESKVNDVVAAIWENEGKNLTWFSSLTQARKFTQWDIDRIRMTPADQRGGGHITNYMTEAGIEMEIVAIPNFPVNLALIVDTSKVRMRALKGRKGFMEKLGKRGDFDEYQIISECSLEMRGYNLGQHGLFTKLS